MKKSMTRRTLLLGGATGLAGASTLSAKPASLVSGFLNSPGTPAVLGGTPVRAGGMKTEWPIYEASDIRMLLDSFYSNKWCSLGADRCHQFEKQWADLNNVPYCIVTSNGTSALFSSLIALVVKST